MELHGHTCHLEFAQHQKLDATSLIDKEFLIGLARDII